MKLPIGEIVTVVIIVVLALGNIALYTGVLNGFDPVHAGRVAGLPPGNAPSVPSNAEDAALDSSSALPGTYVPSQGARHTSEWPLEDRIEFCDGDVSDDCYASNPPSSGRHLPVTRDAELESGDVIDLPPPAGVYSFEIPREAIPHWLEHAGVYVGHHCVSAVCEQLVAQAEDVARSLIDAGERVVMAPSSDLPEDTIGMSSWTRVDVMSLPEYGDERLREFVEAHSCRYDPENLCND